MKLLYRKISENTKIGYYVNMDLMTPQSVFDNIFGKKKHMFSAQPDNLSNTKNKEATTKSLDP